MWERMDPRTRLALGLMATGVVFMSYEQELLLIESSALLSILLGRGTSGKWARSLPLIGPMVGLVFVVTAVSFDVQAAILLSVRLFNLLTTSFIFFSVLTPEELGEALLKLKVPYGLVFMLTAAMRYVPLIRLKIRHIMDAQISRGIDLRFRLGNIGNFFALLMPLLFQSFLLSEELAMAMESRGFGRKGRSSRRRLRLTHLDYGVMLVALTAFVFFIRRQGG